MPLSRDNEKRIRKNYEAIVNEIQKNALDSIIDRLFSKYVLTSEDKERIDAEPTTSGKVRILLDRLLTGPGNGYSVFIGKLKEEKCYQDLAKQIEETDLKDEENIEPETVVSWVGAENLTEEKAGKLLSDSDLFNFSKAISSETFSSDFFRTAGTRLGLDQIVVLEIEKKYRSTPATAYDELLITWRNNLGTEATVRRLLEKLFGLFLDYPRFVMKDSIINTLKVMNISMNNNNRNNNNRIFFATVQATIQVWAN